MSLKEEGARQTYRWPQRGYPHRSYGADKFFFKAKDSLFGEYDSITDLEIGTDKIKSTNTKSAVENISYNPNKFTKYWIDEMFDDINIEADKAYTFTTKNTSDTFLYINNGNQTLDYNSDNFIKITGYTGNLNDLTIG